MHVNGNLILKLWNSISQLSSTFPFGRNQVFFCSTFFWTFEHVSRPSVLPQLPPLSILSSLNFIIHPPSPTTTWYVKKTCSIKREENRKSQTLISFSFHVTDALYLCVPKSSYLMFGTKRGRRGKEACGRIVSFRTNDHSPQSCLCVKARKERLFLTSAWLPPDTSVHTLGICWPPHHRSNPESKKRRPCCKLQPPTWPKKERKKQKMITFNVFLCFFNNLMAAAPALYTVVKPTTKFFFRL